MVAIVHMRIGVMAKRVQNLLGGGGSGLPRGAGLGVKLLGAAALVGIGISQSMYTGQSHQVLQCMRWGIRSMPYIPISIKV